MKLPFAVVLTLLLTGQAFVDLRQPGDVFQVDIRSWDQHRGSCNRGRDKNNPNSARMFDPDAEVHEETRVLNKIWYQAASLAFFAKTSLEADTYNSQFDIRKLVKSFWGVSPDLSADGPDLQPKSGFHLDKLNRVREWYAGVVDLMSTAYANKPKLFCDSPFMEFQYEGAYAYDKDGNEITKNFRTGDKCTLREWEQIYYFWADLGDDPGDHGYILAPKSAYPGVRQTIGGSTYTFPWPFDTEAGQPSYCAQPGVVATTLSLDDKRSYAEGVDSWIQNQQLMILWPQSYSETNEDIAQDTQPEGKHLDDMEVIGITMLHELFHVTKPWDASHDKSPLMPLKGSDNRPVPDWPNTKDSFDPDRRDPQSHRALQCMTLQMFDTTAPETTDINDILAVSNPESYAWYALTAWLGVTTGQDWSTGAARIGNSPSAAITASIPGLKRAEPTAFPKSNNATEAPERRWASRELNLSSSTAVYV